MDQSLTVPPPHDVLERLDQPDRASCFEHQRLIELAIRVADTDDPNVGERWPGEHITGRFEFIDLLDRHYVRLCRRVGARTHPEMERSLQELRDAHERLRITDRLPAVRTIVERHIDRCPLTSPH